MGVGVLTGVGGGAEVGAFDAGAGGADDVGEGAFAFRFGPAAAVFAFGDEVDGFVDAVGDVEEVEVGGADGGEAFGHRAAEPVDEAGPEIGAEEDDGEGVELAGLDEGEGFEEFVHGAKAAGEADEGVAVFDEHDLADEEIVVRDGEGLIGVGFLLHGERDIEAYGDAAGFLGAFVGGFHDAGAAAGDDGEAALGEGVGHVGGELVILLGGLGAGGAKNADRGGKRREGFKTLDEFTHDAKDLPHVFWGGGGGFFGGGGVGGHGGSGNDELNLRGWVL